MAAETKSLESAAAQVTQFLRALSLKQQLLLVGAALLVSGTLFVFVRWMNNPEMKPLFTGMKAEDAQQLATRLAAKKIKYEISPDGSSISVAGDRVDEARLETASQGMPRSGRLGFELFDKPNWGGSDFSEKVNYQRALEGELERTIQTLRDVDAVRVHLVVPPESAFVDREREAKASVTLRLRNGHLSSEAQSAIANLVAGAVDRLKPQNVAVIDADSNRPLGNSTEDSDYSGDPKLEDRLARRLIETLEPVVGPGRIRASVHVEHDVTSADETQETYDPNTAVALSMQRSEEHSGSALPGGIPGTSSNVPNATSNGVAKAAVEDGSQSSKSESGTYAVNHLVRHTLIPSGRLKRLTAALLIDDAVEKQQAGGKTSEIHRKRTPEELKQIEELARASLGLDTSRGDSISVQNLAFESVPSDNPKPPAMAERVQVVVQHWSSLIRYGAILLLFVLIYVLFLRPVKRQVIALLKQGPLPARLQSNSVAGQLAGTEADLVSDGESKPTELSRLKRQLVDKAKSEPASTSRLLQSWLREEGNA